MAQPPSVADPNVPYSLVMKFHAIDITDDQFLQLCSDNSDLRLELTAKRELIIMSPTGSKTGWRNGKINQRLANWAEEDSSGLSFDSSTLLTLPNGAIRSPDAAWLRRDRWEALSVQQQEGIAPLCPDFVVELRSPTDNLSTLQNKMVEYIENGAHLGWLIDPTDKSVYISRPGQPVEPLEDPKVVTGDPVLPGFTLNLLEIW